MAAIIGSTLTLDSWYNNPVITAMCQPKKPELPQWTQPHSVTSTQSPIPICQDDKLVEEFFLSNIVAAILMVLFAPTSLHGAGEALRQLL